MTTRHLDRKRLAELDWRRRFAEDMGDLELVHGTPRTVLRVLGWMVVCEPQEQSAGDIQRELKLSAGSVSAAARLLVSVGLLERVTRRSDRRIHYRLREHGWGQVLEMRFRAFSELRDVADRAIAAAAGDADERLFEIRDTYAQIVEGVESLLRRSAEGGAGPAPTGAGPVQADG